MLAFYLRNPNFLFFRININPQITEMFYDFLSLLFPQCCPACNGVLTKGETILCAACRNDLPRYPVDSLAHNTLHITFAGKVPVSYCYAYYSFRKKSKVQHLLHEFKYKGHKEIGRLIGNWIAYSILEIEKDFGKNEIDFCVPVPLHQSRQRARGYNQSEWLAKGIAEILEIPQRTDVLEKRSTTSSQTKKKRWWRWKNALDVYKSKVLLNGEHVLIVDDVVTTGATLEACATALLGAGAGKVSIIAMAAVV